MTGEMARISDVVVVVDLASTRMIYALVDGRTDARAGGRVKQNKPAGSRTAPGRAGPGGRSCPVAEPVSSRLSAATFSGGGGGGGGALLSTDDAMQSAPLGR